MIRLIYENRIISDDGSGRDRAGIVPEPKGKQKTLRQKDQIPYETLESDDAPTKPNLFRLRDRAHRQHSVVCALFVLYLTNFPRRASITAFPAVNKIRTQKEDIFYVQPKPMV